MEIKNTEKAAFRFEYTRPTYDWYETVKVEIKPSDYHYFRIERRYGPSWWLIGMNPPAKDTNDYRWKETQIGEIRKNDLIRFIEWAKTDNCIKNGSRIAEVKAISCEFDILSDIAELLRSADTCKAN